MKLANWLGEYEKYIRNKPISCPACKSKKVKVVVHQGEGDRRSLTFICEDCGSAGHIG